MKSKNTLTFTDEFMNEWRSEWGAMFKLNSKQYQVKNVDFIEGSWAILICFNSSHSGISELCLELNSDGTTPRFIPKKITVFEENIETVIDCFKKCIKQYGGSK